jgi:hypothetical protein
MCRSRRRRVTYRPRNVSVTLTPVIVVVCGAGGQRGRLILVGDGGRSDRSPRRGIRPKRRTPRDGRARLHRTDPGRNGTAPGFKNGAAPVETNAALGYVERATGRRPRQAMIGPSLFFSKFSDTDSAK